MLWVIMILGFIPFFIMASQAGTVIMLALIPIAVLVSGLTYWADPVRRGVL